jgi:hypothetical protein
MSKGFKEDFFLLLNKIKRGEHFAFTRFSDGETCIMRNEKLVLATDHVLVGTKLHTFGYSEDDHKEFIPQQHGFVRDALVDSFQFSKKNYFVGAGCGECTCLIQPDIPMLRELRPGDEEHWTSPNLLVNSNYSLFLNQMIPQFTDKKIVMVCSKDASFEKLPFEVVKDFRVGRNCIVNDHHLIDEMKSWVEENNIRDHIFLFSASSLSEILIHRLFELNNHNTYIDIGTTLHWHLNLGIERDYLRAYWNRSGHPDLFKDCN